MKRRSRKNEKKSKCLNGLLTIIEYSHKQKQLEGPNFSFKKGLVLECRNWSP